MADSHCDDYGSEDMSDDMSTEELSDEELDVQLREVADKFIDLANQQAQRFHRRMSARA